MITDERREYVRNQASVKQCKRFIVFTEFSNYTVVDDMDDEVRLQLEEDAKYERLDSLERESWRF